MNSSHIRRPETLEELPSDQLHDLTLCAVARVGTSHLELGNCLLAVERSEAFVDYGCSCMKHYAVAIGIGERLAREALRVARRLEELPLMREAAEAGEVPWSNLREVVRVATPEHEEKWLEVATSYNSDIVQKLSGRANPGEAPGHPRDLQQEAAPEQVELTMRLPAEVAEMFQQAVRSLSQELGTRVSVPQAMELLLASYLLGSPTPATVEKLKQEMRKNLVAAVEADERLAERVRYELSHDGRPGRVTEPTPAPWAAVAARQTPVPGNPALAMVSRAPAHWENERVRFSGESRHTTCAQRQEIVRRDCYACSTPGCPNRLWLHVHHVVFHCQGGATVPANLVAVCSRCHRHVHEGKLIVEGTAPGGLEWRDARGRSLRHLRRREAPGEGSMAPGRVQVRTQVLGR